MLHLKKIFIKNINLICSLVTVNCFIACANHEERSNNKIEALETTSNYLNEKALTDSLLYEALEKKNFNAYDKLYGSYLLKYKDRELLFYSLMMANRHDYSQAYFNVFHSLTFPHNDSLGIKSLDKNTRSMALYYLLKSYELGNEDSKYTLEKIFGTDKVVPKSSEYLIFK